MTKHATATQEAAITMGPMLMSAFLAFITARHATIAKKLMKVIQPPPYLERTSGFLSP
jgi:hypothetical protein